MQLHQRARNGQPQARTALGPGILIRRLHEGLAELVQIFRRNAAAGIAHFKADGAVFLPGLQAHFARISELDGVGEQIEHHLLDLERIDHRRQRCRRFHLKRQPLAACLVLHQLRTLAQDIGHVRLAHLQLHLAGLDARHLQDILDQLEHVPGRLVNVRHVFPVFLLQRPEGLHQHHLGKADDRIERRAQFVAHAGQEFRLGARGRLRPFLLADVLVHQFDEAVPLLLQLQPRALQRLHSGAQLRFRAFQPLLLALQFGDVGADGDKAAVADAPLVDLQPAPVIQLHFRHHLLAVLVHVNGLALLHPRLFRRLHHLLIGRARHAHRRRQRVELLIFGIAHDQAAVGIPQHEGFGDGLNRLTQPVLRFLGGLGRPLLIGDVNGNAHKPRRAVRRIMHQGPARPKPDPVPLGVLQPEFVIEAGAAAAQQIFSQFGDGRLLGMLAAGDLAIGEIFPALRQAEHGIHGARPEDAAARQIPVPQAAAPVIQRRIQPRRGRGQRRLSRPCPVGIPVHGQHQRDQRNAGQAKGHAQGPGRAPPVGQGRIHRLNDHKPPLPGRHLRRRHDQGPPLGQGHGFRPGRHRIVRAAFLREGRGRKACGAACGLCILSKQGLRQLPLSGGHAGQNTRMRIDQCEDTALSERLLRQRRLQVNVGGHAPCVALAADDVLQLQRRDLQVMVGSFRGGGNRCIAQGIKMHGKAGEQKRHEQERDGIERKAHVPLIQHGQQPPHGLAALAGMIPDEECFQAAFRHRLAPCRDRLADTGALKIGRRKQGRGPPPAAGAGAGPV